jgi:hypothetical protein
MKYPFPPNRVSPRTDFSAGAERLEFELVLGRNFLNVKAPPGERCRLLRRIEFFSGFGDPKRKFQRHRVGRSFRSQQIFVAVKRSSNRNIRGGPFVFLDEKIGRKQTPIDQFTIVGKRNRFMFSAGR